MIRVALDLDRPGHLMSDQDAGCVTVEGRREAVL